MHAYVAALRRHHRGPIEILLAQKNVYLPPHRRYQFAAIARNAVQYVIPGGRVAPGESVVQAAVREFAESTGIKLPADRLQPLYADLDDTFLQIDLHHVPHHSIETVNLALAEGTTESQVYNHFSWVSVETAPCMLGNKTEYQALPWVTNQLLRALNAGFLAEFINMRANEGHARYSRALAQLILDVLPPREHREHTAPASAPIGEPEA